MRGRPKRQEEEEDRIRVVESREREIIDREDNRVNKMKRGAKNRRKKTTEKKNIYLKKKGRKR